MTHMAMFPLGTPLLPGSAIPLQVFEERYVTMIRDLLAADDPPRFGVVMIERGHEVGGDDHRADIGTIADVVDLRALAGDRYALVAVGVVRFRVDRWLSDDPYPRAEVDEWLDEPSDVGSGTIEDLRSRVTALHAVAAEVQPLPELPTVDLADDAATALYQLAAMAPIGAADRHRLLAAPSAAERAATLSDVLDDARAVWEFRRS